MQHAVFSHLRGFIILCFIVLFVNYFWSLLQDVSSGVSCYPENDFVVDVQCGLKNSAPAIPQGKQDGLISNQEIAEALEEVPRHTGHLKSNRADIPPQVYASSLIESLEHQPPKQVRQRCHSLNIHVCFGYL